MDFKIKILLYSLMIITKSSLTTANKEVISCTISDSNTLQYDEVLVKPFQLSKTVTLLPELPENINDLHKLKIKAPQGMVVVPQGYSYIGDDNFKDEKPRFAVKIASFFMDEHPVTVAQFREFINATGYVTEAERFGNAGVIDSTTGNKWVLKIGANWQFPQGKDYPPAKSNHPVTQVSWNDAKAYCKWVGKRLPNEFEFEFAAKGGKITSNIYPWGNVIEKNGRYYANVWQGVFPLYNEQKDGFKFTSPIGYFGKNCLGLSDMSGNIWQWCENEKYSYTQILSSASKKELIQRKNETKSLRGGSFLCEPSWCHGYRVTGRSGSSPETALMHIGFRCVKDIN